MRIIHGLVIAAVTGTLVACSLDSVDRGSALVIRLEERNEGPADRVAPMASSTPPTAVSGFDCIGINVSGPGIPDSSRNPEPNLGPLFDRLLRRESYCSYRGVLAGPISTTAAGPQEITLVVPPGNPRLVQVVGLKERNGSNDCVREFVNGPPTIGPSGTPVEADAYELGRAVVGLSGDTTVTVPVDWTSLSAAQQIERELKCGDGGAGPTFSPGSFAALAAMSTARYEPGLLYDDRVGQKIYVMGGTTSTAASVYDVPTNAWAAAGNITFTGTLLKPAVLPYPANEILRVGGELNGSSTTTVETYNGSVWGTLTGAPNAIGFSSPVTVGATTYLFGSSPTGTNITIYDHAGGGFSTNPNPLRTPRGHIATALLDDGKVLAVGGTISGTSAIAHCDRFVPGAGTVDPCSDLPAPVWDAVLVPYGPAGNAVIVGGSGTGGSPIGAVYQFDGTAETWTAMASLPEPRTQGGGVRLPDGRIFVFGGRDASGALNTSWFFQNGTWVPGPTMTVARYGFGWTRVPSGKIYILGGKNTGGTALTNVEVWSP